MRRINFLFRISRNVEVNSDATSNDRNNKLLFMLRYVALWKVETAATAAACVLREIYALECARHMRCDLELSQLELPSLRVFQFYCMFFFRFYSQFHVVYAACDGIELACELATNPPKTTLLGQSTNAQIYIRFYILIGLDRKTNESAHTHYHPPPPTSQSHTECSSFAIVV